MKIKTIIIASILTVLSLASCRKEEIVIAPENEMQSVLINVNTSDWCYSWDVNNNYFYAEVDMPEITRQTLKTGLVKMYRVFNYNMSNESQMEMPCTVLYEEGFPGDDDWYNYSVSLDYEFTAGKLYIYYTMNDFYYELDDYFVPGDMQFRCVIVE